MEDVDARVIWNKMRDIDPSLTSSDLRAFAKVRAAVGEVSRQNGVQMHAVVQVLENYDAETDALST